MFLSNVDTLVHGIKNFSQKPFVLYSVRKRFTIKAESNSGTTPRIVQRPKNLEERNRQSLQSLLAMSPSRKKLQLLHGIPRRDCRFDLVCLVHGRLASPSACGRRLIVPCSPSHLRCKLRPQYIALFLCQEWIGKHTCVSHFRVSRPINVMPVQRTGRNNRCRFPPRARHDNTRRWDNLPRSRYTVKRLLSCSFQFAS